MTKRKYHSFSICHGPTAAERKLMEDWIQILVAFVNDDPTFDFGTRRMEEMKVATPNGTIEVRSDDRWDELVRIGDIFAGKED